MASGFRMTGANDNGVIQGTATQVSHLRDLSKEVEELEDELRAMQGYMYKLKNQHRRTLYFRAASNAYRACARTVKATSTLILSLRRGKHGNNEMAQSQLSKDSFCTLYKESFRRLHLAARHLGTEIGSVRFVRESLALLTVVASIGSRLKHCGRLLTQLDGISLDNSLAMSLASSVLLSKSTTIKQDKAIDAPEKKQSKRRHKKRTRDDDSLPSSKVEDHRTLSLATSGGWDLL